MSAHANTSLARTIYDAFNRGDLDSPLAHATDDVEVTLVPFGMTLTGKAGLREFMGNFKTAFPDCTVNVTRMFATDDSITCEFQARGTHKGPLAGPGGVVPATGKPIDYPVVEVWEIRDGKLSKIRNYFDSATVMQQLGVM